MKTRVRGRRKRFSFLLIVILGTGYVAWALLRPLPSLEPVISSIPPASNSPSALTWPTSQAAVAIPGTDILETNNLSKSVPMASTAKIITALLVLDKMPLKVGQSGPTLTITQADVDSYNAYVARDGSVVPVQVGEKLTEYQMLQALMLPSANNIADSLAIWSYGSLNNYAIAAKTYLSKNNLTETNIGADASGLAADSTSTASDLAKLGSLAMQNPVLAEIVGQALVKDFPVGSTTGTIKNVNILLGTNGVVGVKTGNSEEAGGAYISASKTKVDGKDVTIVTAIAGAPNLGAALNQSIPLIKSAQVNFSEVKVVKTGQVVGTYTQPWGGMVSAVASKDLSITAWNGQKTSAKVHLTAASPDTSTTQPVGTAAASSQAPKAQKQVQVFLQKIPTKPTLGWRLTHPF